MNEIRIKKKIISTLKLKCVFFNNTYTYVNFGYCLILFFIRDSEMYVKLM